MFSSLLLSSTPTPSSSCFALILRPDFHLCSPQCSCSHSRSRRTINLNLVWLCFHSQPTQLFFCSGLADRYRKLFYTRCIFSISLKCQRIVKNIIVGSLSSRWNSWIASFLWPVSQDQRKETNAHVWLLFVFVWFINYKNCRLVIFWNKEVKERQ